MLAIITTTGHPDFSAHFGWFYTLSNRPFPFSVQDAADVLMQLSLVAILVMRLARSRREEQRLNSELEAARAVQQVLVPRNVPTIPGFLIESVYIPAGEVGGDFFQIVPMEGGGALLAIGDVSGKGLPAALTVSLLVGTFRTLAESIGRPGEILGRMNRRINDHSLPAWWRALIRMAGARWPMPDIYHR